MLPLVAGASEPSGAAGQTLRSAEGWMAVAKLRRCTRSLKCRGLCALIVILPSLLIAPPGIGAAPTVQLTIEPRTASPGSVVLIIGVGFVAGEPVEIGLDRQPSVHATATSAGELPVTGLVLPPALPAGAHQVFARGLRSGRIGRTLLTVVSLSPTILVRSGPARPGSVVRIHGGGFLPGEQVALALNGAGLAVFAAVPGRIGLITGPDGQFDTSFLAPPSLLAGANALSATGSVSHHTALTTLVAHLPVRTDLYFAGASTADGDRPSLALLNAGHLPASVHLTLFPEAGASVATEHFELTVAPFHRATVPISPISGSARLFGLRVQADRLIAAQLVVLSPSGVRSMKAEALPGTTWFLAEGFTGLSFKETLAVLNPGPVAARLQLNLLLTNGRPGRLLALVAPARSQLVIDVNRYAPHTSVAATVTSSQPVIVSRTLRFGTATGGATTTLGSAIASSTWLFAEGSTVGSAQTYFTILNPGSIAASVTASFYDDFGRPLGNHTLAVNPRHRGTLRVNSVLGHATFTAFITASQPVVVERPMYLGDPNSPHASGSDVPGSNGSVRMASFADGSARAGDHEYILLLNPSAHSARIALIVYPSSDARWARPVQAVVQIPPLSRHTVDVAALLASYPAGDHASALQSLNGVGFVAEQTIYTRTPAGLVVRSTQAAAQ